MKIVVLEAGVMTPGGLSLDVYKQFGEVIEYHTTKQEDVIERIGDADIILLNKLIIDEKVMSSCPNLKFIGLFATGFNTKTTTTTEKNTNIGNPEAVEDYSGFDLSLVLGAQYKLTENIGVDARYNIGLTNVFPTLKNDEGEVTREGFGKQGVIQLGVFYEF